MFCSVRLVSFAYLALALTASASPVPKWSVAQVGSGLQLDTPGASGQSASVGHAATTKDNAHIYGSTYANGYSSSTPSHVQNGMGTGSTIIVNKRDPRWSAAQVGSGLQLDTPGAFGQSASVGQAATTKDNAHIYGSTYANGYSSSTPSHIQNGMDTGSTVIVNKREPKWSAAQVGSGLQLDTPGAFGQSASVGQAATMKDNAHIYGSTYANGYSSSTPNHIQNGMGTGSTVIVNRREPKRTAAQVGSGLQLDTPGAFGQSASVAQAATTKDNAHIYGSTYANGYSSSTPSHIQNGMGTGSTVVVN